VTAHRARLALLLLASCGGSGAAATGSDGGGDDARDLDVVDSSLDADAFGGEVPDAAAGYHVIYLKNTTCMNLLFPTTGGLIACRVLLENDDAGSGSCAAPGLSPATPSDIATINAIRADAGGPPLPGALCVLNQVPSGSAPSWCENNPQAAWCYVHGSCEPDGGCTEALCRSNGVAGEGLVYDLVWFACP
jgi:hypothetical protein